MFKRIEPAETIDERSVRFTFEGKTISAREGDSIAAALLSAGIHCFRITPVSSAPRGPYCMMGACFDCLVEVNGAANQQACMVRAEPGMQVRQQIGRRDLPHDGN